MGSKTKKCFAVVNAGGVDFTLTEGQVAEVPAELFDGLQDAGYVVPVKRGLTLPEAKDAAEKRRAAHLEALADKAAAEEVEAEKAAAEQAEAEKTAAENAEQTEAQSATPQQNAG